MDDSAVYFLPLHLLHLSISLITADAAKKIKDEDDLQSEAGEVSSDDDKSVFELVVPTPLELYKQNPLDLINLDSIDRKESQCDKPTGLSYMLRRKCNRPENNLVVFTENQLGSQEYEELLTAYWGNGEETPPSLGNNNQ